MKLELNRHRDHEGNAIWEDAEPCQICGSLLIDVWTIYDGDKTHTTIGRECMRKAIGHSVHPSYITKAEAEYNASVRASLKSGELARLAVVASMFTDDEMAAMMTSTYGFSAPKWIGLVADKTARANTVLRLAPESYAHI